MSDTPPRVLVLALRAPLVRRIAVRLSDEGIGRATLDESLKASALESLARRCAREDERRSGVTHTAPHGLLRDHDRAPTTAMHTRPRLRPAQSSSTP